MCSFETAVEILKIHFTWFNTSWSHLHLTWSWLRWLHHSRLAYNDYRLKQNLHRINAFSHQNICTINPCLNNGQCFMGYTNKRYLCVCPAGFKGDNCEKGENNDTTIQIYYLRRRIFTFLHSLVESVIVVKGFIEFLFSLVFSALVGVGPGTRRLPWISCNLNLDHHGHAACQWQIRLSTCVLKWVNNNRCRPVFVLCQFYANEPKVQKVLLMGCDWWISIRLVFLACRKTGGKR